MTLYKMVKGSVTSKTVKARCPECGLEFKYPENACFHPTTCGKFECEIKHQHPEVYKK